MATTTPRTAAAYIRVSTEEQTDQSPESQLVEIRKYASRNNLILPNELIYMDEGISGKRSENRPAFQRMIGTAKEKPTPFDVILVWKYSRFARNQEESIVYKTLLRKQCGVDVVSVSEPLPSGQFATLIERIIEWFDEFYSIRLAQEVKRSMIVKAERGDFQTKPPYGYRIKRDAGKKGILEIVPEEAAIVRDVFTRFVNGEGCFTIARALAAQGVITRNGVPFTSARLEYMIYNPIYIGKVRWTPTGRNHSGRPHPDSIITDGDHEPIISAELFQSAQDRMATVKAAWGYKARPTYELKDWLSGLVRCAECNGTLIFYKGRYFKCSNYSRGRCTHTQIIVADVLHEAIIARLTEDISSHQPLACTVTRKKPEGNSEVVRLKTSLADLRRRDARLLDAYLGGALDLKQFTASKSILDSSISEAERRLDEIAKEQDQIDTSAALAANIRSALDTLTSPDTSLEDKNTTLRQITERIVFSRERNTLDITYRLIF